MTTIKAVIRNGRIETEEPLHLPEGTDLLISLTKGTSEQEDIQETSPEGIAAWLIWYDSLHASSRSEKEEREAEDWLKQCDLHAVQKLTKDVSGLFE